VVIEADKMNILITGGTGLIGKELIKFLNNHHNVTVFTRSISKAYKLNGHQINAVSDLNQLDFNQLDVVINLAGEPIADKRWTQQQKEKIEQSRFNITQQLVDRIKQADTPPHTFISGSAIGFYGRQAQAVDESWDNCHPEFSHYLCKKWEDIANQAQSERTRVCLLRTGIVLSDKGGALKKMLPAFKLCLGGPISHGEQMMSWIHIDDMVSAILFILNQAYLHGPINLTAPNPVSNACFSQTLAKTIRRPDFFTMPAKVLTLLFGEMADLLLHGQAVKPTILLNAGFRFHHQYIEEALRNLLQK
jgi:uncharacterized protein (TIGR01777 family)